MKVIVGLGNPGKKYENTRHNVGFEVIRQLARRYGSGMVRGKFDGELMEAVIEGERALLVSPLTYMNRSGNCVQPVRDFYKLSNADFLVVCDDFQLPLGKVRMRAKGSSGGQKGLQDVIRRMGGDDVPRLRIGIGAPPPQWDVADYVLSKFHEEEQADLQDAIQRASQAASDWVVHGIDYCMNQHNRAS